MNKLIKTIIYSIGNSDECCRRKDTGNGRGDVCGRVSCNFELGGQGMPMEKLASEQRLAVCEGVSYVGMGRRIPGKGSKQLVQRP